MPAFWLGTLFILVLSLRFNLMLNAGNYVGFFEAPVANLKQMLFPAITLGFAATADVMRTMRSAMLEELGQDYTRTARSKGLRDKGVIFRHCLKNAWIPVITIVGLELGYRSLPCRVWAGYCWMPSPSGIMRSSRERFC
jgi:peptide/nickel transport system permease protein